jgi:hypothetical protein
MSSPRIYFGEIVDIDDPLKNGRAKIKVFGIFDGLDVEDIPWAEQISGLSFGAKGNGGISVPKLGSIVSVYFDGQNYYRMAYHFEKETDPDLRKELEDSYLGSHSLIYDTSAEPGPLKLFYTQKKGLNFILGGAKIQFEPQPQNSGGVRIIIELGDDQIRMENNKVIVNSSNIELGERAIEAVIKGNTFQTYFNSHTHIGNLGAPTSPPVIPSTPDHLSNVSKTR